MGPSGVTTEEITTGSRRRCLKSISFVFGASPLLLLYFPLELALRLQPFVQVVVQVATVNATFDVNLKRPPMDSSRVGTFLPISSGTSDSTHVGRVLCAWWPDFARACSFLLSKVFFDLDRPAPVTKSQLGTSLLQLRLTAQSSLFVRFPELAFRLQASRPARNREFRHVSI